MAMAALLMALLLGSGSGHGIEPANHESFRVEALDARNLLVSADAPLAGVRIAGLTADVDFLTLPTERPNALRIRLLTNRSPLRLRALPRQGPAFGEVVTANPRG